MIKKTGKATLKDIAKKSGVNVSTVSRVLNKTASISDKVKKKIFKISTEMGYIPNTIARALVTQRSYAIGIVVPNFTYMSGGFFQETMIGIEMEVNRRHYNLLLTKFKGEERHCFNYNVRSGMLDGALVLGDELKQEDLPSLMALPIPVVLINTSIAGKTLPYVCIDNVHGGEVATEHLIKHGYGDLIYIGGGKDQQATRERETGFQQAVAKHPESVVRSRIYYSHFDTALRDSYALMKDLDLSSGKTGIFAASDHIAYGVMKFLNEKGIGIPDKVGLIGFDNMESNEYMSSPLTSIDQKGRNMGEAACMLLLDIIEKKSVGPSFKIKPELVIRRSCGC